MRPEHELGDDLPTELAAAEHRLLNLAEQAAIADIGLDPASSLAQAKARIARRANPPALQQTPLPPFNPAKRHHADSRPVSPTAPTAPRRLPRRWLTTKGASARTFEDSASSGSARGRDWVMNLVIAGLVLVVGAGLPFIYGQRVTDFWPGAAPTVVPSGQRTYLEPLRAPGRVRENTGDRGSCAFESDRLHARVAERATYQCLGPDATFVGDQTISVNLELASENSCAMVWFLYTGDRGFQLTVCADSMEMEKLDGVVLTSIGKDPVALRTGEPHAVSVVVTDLHATVAVDGNEALQANLAPYSSFSGKVGLGVTNIGSTGTAEVSYTDLNVRSEA